MTLHICVAQIHQNSLLLHQLTSSYSKAHPYHCHTLEYSWFLFSIKARNNTVSILKKHNVFLVNIEYIYEMTLNPTLNIFSFFINSLLYKKGRKKKANRWIMSLFIFTNLSFSWFPINVKISYTCHYKKKKKKTFASYEIINWTLFFLVFNE
jgi:hypothetical protein